MISDEALKEAYSQGRLQQVCNDANISYESAIQRAKLENWPRTPKSVAIQSTHPSIALIQQASSPLAKGRIYQEAIADIIAIKVLPHVDQQTPDEVLTNIDQIEKADKIIRRSLGLDRESANGATLNINVLAAGLEVFQKREEKVIDI